VCASSSISINQDMLFLAGHLTRWAPESTRTAMHDCTILCRWPAVHGSAKIALFGGIDRGGYV
jgi:hypothetical protein